MKKKDNFYVTSPIYYASGDLHLGHIYTSCACDILARWNRKIAKNVFYLTGSDEHGQKVEKKAKELNKKPQNFVDGIVDGFKVSLSKMNVSYDYFIRTTDEKHKSFVQKMLQKSFDNGDIYKAEYKGLYCVDCEQYYKEVDLIEGLICPVHKKKVEEMKEENYFFRLSKYQNKLLDFYKKNSDFLSPKNRSQETLNRVLEGLEDISISRSKKTLNWGIELPFDKEHVTYVWFDALFNYLSALDINNKNEFWSCDVHIVGKDIMWFHNVYWPAFLMSCEYELPKKVFAHGWWTVDGEKMGKSMGNQIEPIKVVEEFGLDEFRYYLFSNGTFGEDLDFSRKVFISKINNELNNDLGNLVSRVHSMVFKYFEGKIPDVGVFDSVDEDFLFKLNIFEQFSSLMNDLKFSFALDLVFNLVRETNAYINLVEPWKVKDKSRLSTIIVLLVSTVNLIGEYLECFMPEKSKLLRKQFNFKEKKGEIKFEIIKKGHKLGEKENLFKKFEEDIIKDVKSEKIIEGAIKNKMECNFEKLNLKVGKIISVKQHPEAEKLYVEEIDLGEENPRTIVSGLKDYYSIEELVGKKVIILCNLKPAKLRGIKSEGMVLVSENEKEGNLGLLLSDLEIGENLSSDGKIANSESRIKIDDFFNMDFNSDGEFVYFEGKKVQESGKLFIDRKIKGNIC